MAEGDERIFRVGADDAHRRLDVFLAVQLRLPRAEVRRLIDSGYIRIEGRPASLRAKGRVLAEGARVQVAAFRMPADRQLPQEPAAPLGVLARGAGWLAIDKAPGQPVHPRNEAEHGTVLGAVAARYPKVQGVGEGGLRSGVVHRLDVDTSGVLLVALEEPTWQWLREAFRSHRVRKVYRAIVSGRPARTGLAEPWLRVARHRPARVAASDEPPSRGGAARRAPLSWTCLEQFEHAALVEIRPVTGFLHQIRATFAHLGHPVVGDRVYGAGSDARTEAPRQMLHAASLEFESIGAQSADPDDFAATLERLR